MVSIFDRFIRRGNEDILCWKDISGALHDGIEHYRRAHPEDEQDMDAFLPLLIEVCEKRYPPRSRLDEAERQDARGRIYLSPDRMRAYLCLLPPQKGGADITFARLQEELHYDGIVFGLHEDEIAAAASNRRYFQIIPIARGTPPRNGRDGWLEELFPHRNEIRLESKSTKNVDYDPDHYLPSIRKGCEIYRIHPPIPGKDGVDVTGAAVPSYQGVSVDVPMGPNTMVSIDGESLRAAKDGLLYSREGRFCIREKRIISESLDTPGGSCDVRGGLVIEGSVSGGAVVKASGDLYIIGEVRDAEVSAGGTVRILKGIHGTAGRTSVKAGRQVQSPLIENAKVEAGGAVLSETVVDSEVVSGSAVYVTGGRGLILGGVVSAAKLIECRQIGSVAAKRTRVVVGYSPEVYTRRDSLQKELAQAEGTLATLWKNISELRKIGRMMTEEQETLLDTLVKQRALYEEHEKRIKEDLKKVQKFFMQNGTGRIRCEQLHPGTDVQIGQVCQEIRVQENGCDIHPFGEMLLMR